MIYCAFDCYFNNRWNGGLSRKHLDLLDKWTKKFWHSAKTGCISVTVPLEPQIAIEFQEIQVYLFYLGYKVVWHEEYIEVFFV